MSDKHWPNTWTEVEDLGNGKFAASVTVGHRVFFDKADGNKPKKHKLTDERPGKDYVLIQSAKCCVEIYPFYAVYYDVQHEEVRVEEERWVVERLFKSPDKWRGVDAYNPVITVEEYSEPAGDVVKVTITYDTDYGTLTVEYLQRDGNPLKHNVTFKNTSGSTQTFRVLQKWAGIVGNKVKTSRGEYEITTKKILADLVFTFGSEEFPFGIQVNLTSMYDGVDFGFDFEREVQGDCNQCAACCDYFHHCQYFNPDLPDKCEIHIDKVVQQWKPAEETFNEWLNRKDKQCICCFHIQGVPPQRYELVPNCSFSFIERIFDENTKIPNCLLMPIVVDVHPKGLKTDFIYGDWVLAQDESLEIDPDITTISPPGQAVTIDDGIGPGGFWVKFDVSPIAGATATLAKLQCYQVYREDNGGRPDTDANFWNINDQGWTEALSAAEIFALAVSDLTAQASGFGDGDNAYYDSADIATIVNVDIEAENTYCSIRTWDDDHPVASGGAKDSHGTGDLYEGKIWGKSGARTYHQFAGKGAGNPPKLYVEYDVAAPEGVPAIYYRTIMQGSGY